MTEAVRRIILTGAVQSGKTTLAEALVKELRRHRQEVAGIIARGLWENGQRSGFDLVDIGTGRVTPLARRKVVSGSSASLTGFDFFVAGWKAGKRALAVENCRQAEVVVVDEVGKLELAGRGWAPLLPALLSLTRPVHVWIVRESLLAQVRQIWKVPSTVVVRPDACGDIRKNVDSLLSAVKGFD